MLTWNRESIQQMPKLYMYTGLWEKRPSNVRVLYYTILRVDNKCSDIDWTLLDSVHFQTIISLHPLFTGKAQASQIDFNFQWLAIYIHLWNSGLCYGPFRNSLWNSRWRYVTYFLKNFRVFIRNKRKTLYVHNFHQEFIKTLVEFNFVN